MVPVIENTVGKIRDLPIDRRLKKILSFAGSVAGIDEVIVTSGGQCVNCSKRVGSYRHDNGNAADLDLKRDGRILRFTDTNELPFFEAFVEATASFGATGIGGDVPYMGETRLHVGFGSRATWGGEKGRGYAPDWLEDAAIKGWNNPLSLPNSPVTSSSRFSVNARSGLNLRSGPGLNFRVLKTLPQGTIVTVQDFDGDWAQIDLQGDGVIDGYVFRSFLKSMQQNVNLSTFTVPLNIEENEEDCAPDNAQERNEN